MNPLSTISNRPRFAPIRNLTPDRLTRMLDSFEQGYLAEAALAWDTIEKRDETIKSVAPKRKKAIARHGWEVIVLPNLPPEEHAEALEHKAALEYFYTNLTCTNALDENERGGFKLLVRQMMDAIGKRYAIHEILWKPEVAQISKSAVSKVSNLPSVPNNGPNPSLVESRGDTTPITNCQPTWSDRGNEVAGLAHVVPPSGGLKNSASSTVNNSSSPCLCATVVNSRPENLQPENLQTNRAPKFCLSAEFRFVPLWFFENTTGRLRFVPTPYFSSSSLNLGKSGSDTSSIPLAPGSWMITAGEGLMLACSVAWMYKTLPLQDWLDYSQKYGKPALVASTSADRNSPEWLELEKTLDDFLSELTAMTGSGEKIQLVDLKGAHSDNLPFERLIARMDRLITALWRGNDLSTLSREQGYGASLQQGETDILEQDDAELVSETLNTYVDRYVIQHLFGAGIKPKAALKILVTPKQSTPQDLAIDEFLVTHGARLAINDTLARYGRAEANEGEPALQLPNSPQGRAGLSEPAASTNRSYRGNEVADSRYVLPPSGGPENPRPSVTSTVNNSYLLSPLSSRKSETNNVPNLAPDSQ